MVPRIAGQAKRRGHRGGEFLRHRPRHAGDAPGQFAACDVRDSTKQAIPSLTGLVAFATIGVACTVVGLAGLALWLADVFQARPGIVMISSPWPGW